jgi:hypothetical protein
MQSKFDHRMKTIMTLLICLACSFGYAQDKIHTFESSQLKLNYKGQPMETSTTTPSTIKVDIEAGTMTLNTENAEVREMLGDKMVFNIIKQMGQMRAQYSLQIDEFLLAHFYTDMGMIILTRTDTHPLQWGIQFMNVSKL